MIAIIDYGLGNLGSISNMLKKIGAECVITSDKNTINKASKLILPGVGAFDNGISNLDNLGLIDVLAEKVVGEGYPILGICLGMQLLTKQSEEGTQSGLGFVDAETVKFEFPDSIAKLKVPHMGWNTVEQRKESKLFKDMFEENRFYFVHSYHVVCANVSDILTTTVYGIEFVSSFEKNNIYGSQFHPEKSHKFGMQLLKNFVEL